MCTISDNNDFIEFGYILCKVYVNDGCFSYCDFLGLESYAGKYKDRIACRQIQDVLSVGVCHNTIGSTFFLYSHSDEEFAFLVGNTTVHGS